MTETNQANDLSFSAALTSLQCSEIWAYKMMPVSVKSWYTVVASSMAFCMVLVNVFTLLVIWKKKLYLVQSNKLILLMTIMDTGNAIVNGYVQLIVIWHTNASCKTWTAIEYFLNFFYSSPIYVITLISIDRFLHVQYPCDYRSILTPLRFKCAVVISFTLNCVQSGIFVLLITLYSIRTARLILTTVNFIILLLNGFLYLVSRIILAQVQAQDSFVLTTSNRTITKVATLYLALIMLLKVAPMVIYFIFHSYAESFQQEITVTLYLDRFSNSYSIVNSCVFIYMNRKARDYIKELNCCKNRVHVMGSIQR